MPQGQKLISPTTWYGLRVAASSDSQAPVQLSGSTSVSASNSLEDLMNAKYGSSLAKTFLLVLRGYDANHGWRKTLDLMHSMSTRHVTYHVTRESLVT
eukprot:3979799-Pleurochrysis_carterae.AAC.1